MSSHLEGLNTAQREAVLATDGPLLVLAGAGAGKTRVIAHRILEIIRKGTPPEQILAVTFTNKAATEMRERVLGLLEKHRLTEEFSGNRSAGAPFVSTFHSLGLLILKENARLLGYKKTLAIYDRADSLREIKQALKHIGAEDIEPRSALGLISKQKGQGIDADAFGTSAETPRERHIASAWLIYEQSLKKENAVDFDDLLLRTANLLRDNADVRETYRARWRYIHIDEYQDTNAVQAQIAQFLVGPEKNICAVGDIDQTIYGWRGAQIANIMSFEKSFPGAKVVLLEENYRSTKNILAAANDVISKNTFRREKNLYTKNQDGEALSLYQAFDEMDEAGFIARIIGEKLRENALPRDFAVLYRANFQSRAIEEQLLAAGIPYQVLGTRFFERREVKDVLSFIRAALMGTMADIARIANVPPRGIGRVTLLKLLGEGPQSLTGATREKVSVLERLFARIREAAEQLPPSKLIQFVVTESGMERVFKDDKFEGAERLENIRELVNLAARYDAFTQGEGLEKFLEDAALRSDQDELKEDANAVRLMTVHASKGLEFKTVFITGLEEGLFPYERDGDDSADKEEERRLCYVAITRAMQKVFLTFASYRTMFGSKNPTSPSQFLSDISDHLIELEAPERLGRTIYLD